jgi:hypothetical protein
MRRQRWGLVLLVMALASPALAGPVRCQTHHEPTLNRLMTLCDDGMKAVSNWCSTLQQWQTTIMPSPGRTCTGQLNQRTQQVEGRWR